MAQYQITLDDQMVQGVLTRNEGIAQVMEQVLQQILEVQVTEHVGAQPYEHTAERRGYRNGARERTLTTRIGTLTLQVPRVRDGRFSPELFARYQRSEQALVLSLIEMVLQGVSTRKVTHIVEELCGTTVSKSFVSSVCARLDPVLSKWNERPLREVRYPFVLVDALVVRVREHGRVRQRSLLIATGVREDGYREVLGYQLAEGESTATWTTLFTWLNERGLRGVDLVVSDDHAGLVQAIQTQLQGAVWQRCQTHFTRNILDACPKRVQAEVLPYVREILTAPDPATARQRLQDVLARFAERAPKALDVLEAGFDDATAVLTLPVAYRQRLRTTNSVERLNEEIRRRERVIRIFPSEASVERLLGALLMEHTEAWQTSQRYLDMTEYWTWRAAQEAKQPSGVSRQRAA